MLINSSHVAGCARAALSSSRPKSRRVSVAFTRSFDRRGNRRRRDCDSQRFTRVGFRADYRCSRGRERLSVSEDFRARFKILLLTCLGSMPCRENCDRFLKDRGLRFKAQPGLRWELFFSVSFLLLKEAGDVKCSGGRVLFLFFTLLVFLPYRTPSTRRCLVSWGFFLDQFSKYIHKKC